MTVTNIARVPQRLLLFQFGLTFLLSGLIDLKQNIIYLISLELMKLPQSTPRPAKPSAWLNLHNIRFTEMLVPEAIWVQELHQYSFTLIFSHGFIEKFKRLNHETRT